MSLEKRNAQPAETERLKENALTTLTRNLKSRLALGSEIKTGSKESPLQALLGITSGCKHIRPAMFKDAGINFASATKLKATEEVYGKCKVYIMTNVIRILPSLPNIQAGETEQMTTAINRHYLDKPCSHGRKTKDK